MLFHPPRPLIADRSVSASTPVRRRGQSVAEFAIILPILLLLLAAAIDLGRLFYAFVAVENAAKEGALFGARNPLCANSGNPNCASPNNVVWHVQTEAANIGADFTTTVACRNASGALVQPINDCLDGYTYHVTVTYPFNLITPILGSLVNQNLVLRSDSQATVISDAFDPSGLEVLVWVNHSNAENGPAISTACSLADPSSSPSFYFAPCQDANNVNNYLQFDEGASVGYKVRVRNTGNLGLTSIDYSWAVNGSSIGAPGTCGGLPTSIAKGAAPAFCTFSRTAAATNPIDGFADFTIQVVAVGDAGSLSTGPTNGIAVVRVVPVPKLAVNLRAAAYRLAGDGDGLIGNPQFVNGPLTLNRNPAATQTELRDPTGWFYLSVVNQGGQADNFALTVTQQGSPVTIPCNIPSALAPTGEPGSTFVCLFSRTFSSTQAHAFVASATADNVVIVGGNQTSVTVTTATCASGRPLVPNLVDRLNPSPDGTNKNVGQAKALWTAAGFTSVARTSPSSASNSQTAITQTQRAYTCANNSNVNVTVGAQ
jgi:Flp pilus assembly protein TadG